MVLNLPGATGDYETVVPAVCIRSLRDTLEPGLQNLLPPNTGGDVADYDPRTIETKWLKRWDQADLYRVDLDKAQRPFYNLMEFPYPSGEGLHVGHFYTYSGADTYGRYQRMIGKDVFQPIGFDRSEEHTSELQSPTNL